MSDNVECAYEAHMSYSRSQHPVGNACPDALRRSFHRSGTKVWER